MMVGAKNEPWIPADWSGMPFFGTTTTMKMYIFQYQWGLKNVNDVHLIHLGVFKPTRFSWMDSVPIRTRKIAQPTRGE